MTEKENPNQWGGARERAGRPKKESIRQDISVYLSQEQWDAMNEEAKENGEKITALMLKTIRDKADALIRKKKKNKSEE
ncbi:hypothetical protein [Cohnella soli]|uniref:CopG family transcriptional regulator n=1 Tax=Cohnella soli TaxID=425005 RepID=A0ABW0HP17_9BACL